MLCIMDAMTKIPYQPRSKDYTRKNVNMPPDVEKKARKIGGGNMSRGIAIAVRQHPEPLDTTLYVGDDGIRYEVHSTPKPLITWRNAPESEKE